MSSPNYTDFINPSLYRNVSGSMAGGEHEGILYQGLRDFEGDENLDFSMFDQADDNGEDSNSFPVGTSAFTSQSVMLENNTNPSNMYRSSDGFQSVNSGGSNGSNRPHFYSSQSAIIVGRGNTVREKHGQITPPDEPNNRAPSSKKRSKPATYETDPAKSERARNAANKRHEASRKRSRDLLENPEKAGTPDSEEGEAEGQRQKYREKNRLAAAKCRAKKKENNDGLEDSARDLSKINTALKQEVQAIRQELTTLRTLCLAHQPGSECKCGKIHQYNHNRAQAMATDHPYRNMPLSPSFGDPMASLIGGGSGHDFGSMDQQMYDQMMSGSMAGMGPMDLSGGGGQHQAFGDPSSNFPFSRVSTPDSANVMTPTASSGKQTFDSLSFDHSTRMASNGGWR